MHGNSAHRIGTRFAAVLVMGCSSGSTTPPSGGTTDATSSGATTTGASSSSSLSTSTSSTTTSSNASTQTQTATSTGSQGSTSTSSAPGSETVAEASDESASTPSDAGISEGSSNIAGDGSLTGGSLTDTSQSSSSANTDSLDLPALTISSDTASIEFTPALYAAENLYPGTAEVVTGGIPLLLSDTNIDLGTNAETQTLRRSVERPDLRIIFTVTETFYRIIARGSAGVESLSDLADKRIGTPAQTSAAFYVYKTLTLAGLEIGTEPGQVEVTSLFPGEGMVTALAGNNPTVEAVAAWEPYPQLALDALGGTGPDGDGIVFQDRDVYREIVNLHSTEAKLADPTIRRGIVAFVRSLIQATQWYRENPALAQAFVADTLGHEPELIERVWEDERFGGILAPDLLDVLEEEEVWLANEESRTPRTRDELAPLIDDSIVTEAIAGL